MFELKFDFDTGYWAFWELGDGNVDQLELATYLDRQNLTLGGAEGLKLLCKTCQAAAELIEVNLQPELISCPSCGIKGGADAIFEEARIYAVFEKRRNNARVNQRGVHTADLLGDINDYLSDERAPGVPAFIFRENE